MGSFQQFLPKLLLSSEPLRQSLRVLTAFLQNAQIRDSYRDAHFAHLRAIAEGIDPKVSAAKYLCTEHGHEAVTANRQTIDAVRTIARVHAPGSGWRLIGLTIRPEKTLTPEQLKNAQKEVVKAHVCRCT